MAVHGSGRMAGAIVATAAGRGDVTVETVVGRSRPDWDWFGEWCEHLEDIEILPEVMIDFSLPDGTSAVASWCRDRGVPLVSGVTGLEQPARDLLCHAASTVPVLWSPNLSFGVNLLARLAADTARVVPEETPVHIEDVHHQWKKDAPSGTALMLAREIERQMGLEPGGVKIDSAREGEVVGDHRVTFELAGETLELTHRARDRSIFARGALEAAMWLQRQPPGLYSAADWLASLLRR
jgi:4-hydroxy-tetrahydrodipicolinate reductase